MPGKFEVFKDKAGEFRFRLKAANGQIILASEGYKAKSSYMNGIESLRTNSQVPDRLVGKKTRSGKLSFNVTATNGQVVGTSQSYKLDSGCRNGMRASPRTRPVPGSTTRPGVWGSGSDGHVRSPRSLTAPRLLTQHDGEFVPLDKKGSGRP